MAIQWFILFYTPLYTHVLPVHYILFHITEIFSFLFLFDKQKLGAFQKVIIEWSLRESNKKYQSDNNYLILDMIITATDQYCFEFQS